MFTILTNIILHIVQSADVKNIAVYQKNDYKNVEVMTSLQFRKAEIDDKLELMKHSKEDGTVITDHEVKQPVTITLKTVISDDDSGALAEVLDFYKNATPLIVKAKGELFTNLVISEKPYKVKSTSFDKTVYKIKFTEVLNAKTQYVKLTIPEVRNKQNASTQKTGHKQARQITPKPSILRQITNKITGSP